MPFRQLRPFTLCTLLFLASCTDDSGELAALEARVAELERTVAASSESTIQSNSTGRNLQDGTAEDPIDESGGDGPSAEEPEPATPEALPVDIDLLFAAQEFLQGSSFFGESDPEFGGTTVEGTPDAVTVSMVRAGLEDRALVHSLLLALGFDSETIAPVGDVDSDSGSAVSETGAHSVTWANNPEASEVTIQRS